MKIKNNTVSNQSVASLGSAGVAHKKWLTIPGEATLELEDDVWKENFEAACAKQLEAGVLSVVEAPAKTAEELAKEEAEALAAAEALVASKKTSTKTK